jgi:5'(3')-deoxyribonucleotidase
MISKDLEKIKIKIDIDGVLRDILPSMCKAYNNAFKCNIRPEDVIEYELDKTFTKCMEEENITPYEWFFERHTTYINIFSSLLDRADEAMRMLHEKGYYIIIVSYQKTNEQQIDTLLWLKNKGIYYDSICFTDKKELIDGDIVVDDNIKFLDNCRESRKICIDAPYNIGKHQYEHYKSLYDFASIID